MTLENSVHLRHTDDIKQGYKYGLVNSKVINKQLIIYQISVVTALNTSLLNRQESDQHLIFGAVADISEGESDINKAADILPNFSHGSLKCGYQTKQTKIWIRGRSFTVQHLTFTV